jgi:hypothetical protein
MENCATEITELSDRLSKHDIGVYAKPSENIGTVIRSSTVPPDTVTPILEEPVDPFALPLSTFHVFLFPLDLFHHLLPGLQLSAAETNSSAHTATPI